MVFRQASGVFIGFPPENSVSAIMSLLFVVLADGSVYCLDRPAVALAVADHLGLKHGDDGVWTAPAASEEVQPRSTAP